MIAVFISILSTVFFFAGKYEDFCLRKIERIVYVLVVITFNIHTKYVIKNQYAFVMNRFYLYLYTQLTYYV